MSKRDATSEDLLWIEILKREDLLIEILIKRVPIKILCRSRCVCKSWNSVISSPSFINLYLSFFAQHTHRKKYLYTFTGSLEPWQKYENPFSLTTYLPHQQTCHTRLRYPFRPRPNTHPSSSSMDDIFENREFYERSDDSGLSADTGYSIIGVINGVICISYTIYANSYSDSTFLESTFLWNPSIYKYVSLPIPSLVSQNKSSLGIGFGFNTSNNDFKVVRVCIMTCEPAQTIMEYEVYSSRAGCWRKASRVSNIKTRGFQPKTGFFLNGGIHWIVKSNEEEDKYSMLMFDCVEEVFRELNLPDRDNENKIVRPDKPFEFAEYSGKLVVRMGWNAWALDWNGVSPSWKYLSPVTDVSVTMNDEDKAGCSTTNFGFGYLNSCEKLYHPRLKLFEETLFLMDATNCESYTKEDKIYVDSKPNQKLSGWQ